MTELAEETWVRFGPRPQDQMLVGHIELGQPTGRYRQDDEGYWVEEWTPTLHRNGRGEVTRITPNEGAIKVKSGDTERMLVQLGGTLIPNPNLKPEPRRTFGEWLRDCWAFFQ